MIDSIYFDHRVELNGKSLFYLAVENEMFDIATKLYKKYHGYFNVNANNLLYNNCEKLKVVEYLIDFPEFNVNSKNKQDLTSIELLYHSNLNDKIKNKIILTLFKREELEFDPYECIRYFALHNQKELETILSKCKPKKNELSLYGIEHLFDKMITDFIITIIKSNIFQIKSSDIVDFCIEKLNVDIFHQILNGKIPEDKEMKALDNSITNSPTISTFKYLMKIIPFSNFY